MQILYKLKAGPGQDQSSSSPVMDVLVHVSTSLKHMQTINEALNAQASISCFKFSFETNQRQSYIFIWVVFEITPKS
jgi:hypothetical protein